MQDPNKIRLKVAQIIAQNEKDGTGWKNLVPFPVATESLKNVEIVYFKQKGVYVANGVVYTPEDMRDYLLLKMNNLPPSAQVSLPPRDKHNVGSTLEGMSISLFPFVQYDQGTHHMYIWIIDENGYPRDFAEVSVPFFFYEYNFIRVMLMNMPDVNKIEDLWTRLVYTAKKGYAYALDEHNLWKLIGIGFDVIRGVAPYRAPRSTFYITTTDDIINPVVDPYNHPIKYKDVYKAVKDEKLASTVKEEIKESEDKPVKTENYIPSTPQNISVSDFKKALSKWEKNLAYRHSVNSESYTVKTWENSMLYKIIPFYQNQNYDRIPLDSKYLNVDYEKKFEFESVGERIHLIPFYPILKNMTLNAEYTRVVFTNKGSITYMKKDIKEALRGVSAKPYQSADLPVIPEEPYYLALIQHIPFTSDYIVPTTEGFIKVNSEKAKEIIQSISATVKNSGVGKSYEKASFEVDKLVSDLPREPKKEVKQETEPHDISALFNKGHIDTVINTAKQEAKEKIEEVKSEEKVSKAVNHNQITKFDDLLKAVEDAADAHINPHPIIEQYARIVANEAEEELKDEIDLDSVTCSRNEKHRCKNIAYYEDYFLTAIETPVRKLKEASDNSINTMSVSKLIGHMLADKELSRFDMFSYEKMKKYTNAVLKAQNKISPLSDSEIKYFIDTFREKMKKYSIPPDNENAVTNYPGVIMYLIFSSHFINFMDNKLTRWWMYTNTYKPQAVSTFRKFLENPSVENAVDVRMEIEDLPAYQVGIYLGYSIDEKYENSLLNPDYDKTKWGYESVDILGSDEHLIKTRIYASMSKFYQDKWNTGKDIDEYPMQQKALLFGIADGFSFVANKGKLPVDYNDLNWYEEAVSYGFYDLAKLMVNVKFVEVYYDDDFFEA